MRFKYYFLTSLRFIYQQLIFEKGAQVQRVLTLYCKLNNKCNAYHAIYVEISLDLLAFKEQLFIKIYLLTD
jgi:hypothetical protein